MFIPLGSDRPKRHIPWVTWGLIATNFIIYLVMNSIRPEPTLFDGLVLQPRGLPNHQVFQYMLVPTALHWYQFITYQFLHADFMHVFGNMFFLYIFGPHVEDRLRWWGFSLFYLLGGVAAGGAHLLMSDNPVLGASGSICAVTGAYLVLFPDTHIKFFIFYFWITIMEIPATWVIGIYAALDFLGMLQSAGHHFAGNTAYSAHLGGYLFGFVVAMTLLKTRILARERWDLLALWAHYQRRTEYSKLIEAQDRQDRVGAGPLSPKDQELANIRATLLQAIKSEKYDLAATEYQKLIAVDPTQVLNQQPQQTLGNYLMQTGQHELAAKVYEAYLAKYRIDSQIDQITLLLALIYVRYQPNPTRAKELLPPLIERLRDAGERDLAKQLLEESGS